MAPRHRSRNTWGCGDEERIVQKGMNLVAVVALVAVAAALLMGAVAIRQTFADDIGVDRLGVGARRREGAIHFAFPIAVIVGVRGR